jgi:predicted xylose isomerase-like sugar epimerase
MKRLLEADYTGRFSYECTSPIIQNIDDLKAPIEASITYLRGLLDPR